MKKIIIVGGGAGGLELATLLGKKLGKLGKAEITLIDKNTNHLWKPLLHEIATGTLNDELDHVSYFSQAQNNSFIFKQGQLINIDRDNKVIELNDVIDHENQVIFPKTSLSYDLLVIAIGSTSNDFGTPGVKEYCTFLDDQESAKRFRKSILSTFFRFSSGIEKNEKLNIAIVGAGATGVELTTELFRMIKTLGQYGFEKLEPSLLNITLIEATDRILPALPENVSKNIQTKLEELGAIVLTKTKIVKADNNHFYPEDEAPIPADIMMWTAGVKAADFLKDLAGLETNRVNQLIVKPTLQTTRDDSIFAIGDCTCCAKAEGGFTPATAQAAHQMASICAVNIVSIINNETLKHFQYNNKGTIISLANTAQGVIKTIGKNQMGVKGWIASCIYRMLYRLHQIALFGPFKTFRLARANKVYRSVRTTINMN
ncbi:NAD(P)/FAD-dependent oxidoreductase [Orbus sturtevantii]|uniref:NAD(P)/FAD-dependent oxidoreductase n=1 Tax=Orbus sturtevantii TaxID=3074109 RepID=UPI00370D6140